MSLQLIADKCESCERLTYSPINDAKWCCFCGAKLEGETEPFELPAGTALVQKCATLEAEVKRLRDGGTVTRGEIERLEEYKRQVRENRRNADRW